MLITKEYRGKEDDILLKYLFIVFAIVLILVPHIIPLYFTPDFPMYHGLRLLPPNSSNMLNYEPYFLLSVFLNRVVFNSGWHTFLLFFTVPYVMISMYLIKKISISPIFSLYVFTFMFYIHFGLSGIRNGLAIAFVWWGIYDLFDDNKIGFFTKITIAFLCHYSSIVFLLFYFIKRDSLNRTIYFLLPVIGFIFGIFVFTFDFFMYLTRFLPEFLSVKVQSYLRLLILYPMHELNQINVINSYSLFALAVYYAFLFMPLTEEKEILFVKIIGVGLFLFFSMRVVPTFSFRFFVGFMTFLVFLIPYLPQKFPRHSRNFIVFWLAIAVIILSWNFYVRHKFLNFACFN